MSSITRRELIDAGYKAVDPDEEITEQGKYFHVKLDNILNYIIYWLNDGHIYRAETDTLLDRGFSLAKFEARVKRAVEYHRAAENNKRI